MKIFKRSSGQVYFVMFGVDVGNRTFDPGEGIMRRVYSVGFRV